METELLQAFDSLVPSDQAVVAAVVVSLCRKDKELHDLTNAVKKMLLDNDNAA